MRLRVKRVKVTEIKRVCVCMCVCVCVCVCACVCLCDNKSKMDNVTKTNACCLPSFFFVHRLSLPLSLSPALQGTHCKRSARASRPFALCVPSLSSPPSSRAWSLGLVPVILQSDTHTHTVTHTHTQRTHNVHTAYTRLLSRRRPLRWCAAGAGLAPEPPRNRPGLGSTALQRPCCATGDSPPLRRPSPRTLASHPLCLVIPALLRH